jgi:glycosyltransferase involved in cell wall biosynthesis
MLIGIDASRANKTVKTGVEWYAFHLIQALKKLTVEDGNQWVLYSRQSLRGGLEDLPENWYYMRVKWLPKYLWTQIRMSWELWRRPCEVFFSPAHVLPMFHRPERSVVTIHDVGFRRYPHLYKRRTRQYHETTTKEMIATGSRIITVSEFCGRELVQLYGADPSKIAITHLGIDHEVYRPIEDDYRIEQTLGTYRIPRPYFLFIGRLEEKKNVVNLIKAFNLYKDRRGAGDPTILVLAGPQGYGYEAIKRCIAGSSHRAQIMEVGYLPEEDVPIITAGALGYVHISWYEGFGIPPVQAMACGCPVIASNNSSLPEILGEGNALFVRPDDVTGATEAMTRLADDQALRANLRARGIEWVKKYTWEETAKQTLPVLTQWQGGSIGGRKWGT